MKRRQHFTSHVLALSMSVLIMFTRAHSIEARQADATPAADVPVATECTVQPRTLEEIAQIAETSGPAAQPGEGERSPVDATTVEAVTQVIRLAIACANANDPLRWLALFSDSYIRQRFGSDHPDDLGSLEAALSQTPTPADETDLLSLVEVRNVEQVEVDRVAADVVTE